MCSNTSSTSKLTPSGCHSSCATNPGWGWGEEGGRGVEAPLLRRLAGALGSAEVPCSPASLHQKSFYPSPLFNGISSFSTRSSRGGEETSTPETSRWKKRRRKSFVCWFVPKKREEKVQHSTRSIYEHRRRAPVPTDSHQLTSTHSPSLPSFPCEDKFDPPPPRPATAPAFTVEIGAPSCEIADCREGKGEQIVSERYFAWTGSMARSIQPIAASMV